MACAKRGGGGGGGREKGKREGKSFMPKQTREKRIEKEILRVLSSRPEFSGSVFSLLY